VAGQGSAVKGGIVDLAELQRQGEFVQHNHGYFGF
jgi:hypothetical protein